MQGRVINTYKEIGETPLEVIVRTRAEFSIPEGIPITYAGRLDPMAEGVLILLTGDKVHEKEKFNNLDKEYEFKILFGFSTDTYDLLGRINNTDDVIFKSATFEKALQAFKGKSKQEYPPYSSKTIDGMPLFEYARKGRLHEIEIPTRDIEIKELEPLKKENISSSELRDYIRENISKVKGDFRQKETLDLWNAYVDNSMKTSFDIATCRVFCTSGTYVRALVNDIGKQLTTPTTTFSIKRTVVGRYKIN